MLLKTHNTNGKKILVEWGTWLNTISWTHFCTFTTHFRLSKYAARVKMERLTASLMGTVGQQFNCFWVAEPFACQKDYHVHALIKMDTLEISPKPIIIAAWHEVTNPAGYGKHNLAAVEEYAPTKGAHFYIVKHIEKPNIDYDLC